MRTVHWLFLFGVALFLSGLVFIVAGARLARRAPAQSSEVAITPTASVKQIMQGIVGPAADRVFASVKYTETLKGREEQVPHTDAEWQAVGNDAGPVSRHSALGTVSGDSPSEAGRSRRHHQACG